MSDIVIDDSKFSFDDLVCFVNSELVFDNLVKSEEDLWVMVDCIRGFFDKLPDGVVDFKDSRVFSLGVVRELCVARVWSSNEEVVASRVGVGLGSVLKWLDLGETNASECVVSGFSLFFLVWGRVDGFLKSFLDTAGYLKAVNGDVRAMELCYRRGGDLDNHSAVTVNNVNNGVDLRDSMEEIVRRINED